MTYKIFNMTSNISIEPQEYHFNCDTSFSDIKTYLNQNGFVVITNVLTQEEINQTKEMFFSGRTVFQILILFIRKLTLMAFTNITK